MLALKTLRAIRCFGSQPFRQASPSFKSKALYNCLFANPEISNLESLSGAISRTMVLSDIPVTVLFGTEYGFSQEVAEEICKTLCQKSRYRYKCFVRDDRDCYAAKPAVHLPRLRRPVLRNMADYPEGFELGKAQALLIACSTQVCTSPVSQAQCCSSMSYRRAQDLLQFRSDLSWPDILCRVMVFHQLRPRIFVLGWTARMPHL